MSLISDLKRIEIANYDFVDWAKSLRTNEKKTEIISGIAIQLRNNGVPVGKIMKAYVQLADHQFVKLDRLTNDTIAVYTHYACPGHTTSHISEEDESDYLVSSDSSCSKNDNEIKVPDDLGKPQDILPAQNVELEKKDCKGAGKNEEQKESEDDDNHLSSISSSLNIRGNTSASSSVIDKPQINENIDFLEQESSFQATKVQKDKESLDEQQSRFAEMPSMNLGTEIHYSAQETGSEKVSRLQSAESICEAVGVTSDKVRIWRNSLMKKLENSLNVDVTAKINDCDSLNFQKNALSSNSFALKPLNQQSEMTSCILTNDENSISSKPCNDLNHIKNKEDLLINVHEGVKSSNVEIRSINREEKMAMLGLKEQLEKSMSKKNMPLPVSSTNSLPSMGEKSSLLTVPNKLVRNNKFSTISTCTNNVEKTCKYFEKSSILSNEGSQILGNTNVKEPHLSESNEGSQILGNTNVKEPHLSESNIKGKHENSQPNGSLNHSKPSEDLGQIVSQLHVIKKMVESRKRLSEDSGNKVQTAKKRHISEQSSTCLGLEITGSEDHIENCNEEILTRESSKNMGKIPQENHSTPSIQLLSLNDNKDIPKTKTNSKEGYQTSISNNQNQYTNEQISQIRITKDKELSPDHDFNVHKSQCLSKSITSVVNPVCVLEEKETIISQEKDESEMISTINLVNKQSAAVIEDETLLERPSSLQAITKSVINFLAKESIPPDTNSALGTTVNEDQVDLVTGNKQGSCNKISIEKTQSATSPSKFPILINSNLVDEAVRVFVACFCNHSDENLSHIPNLVCLSVNQYYRVNQKLPESNKTSEFLKFYLCYYIGIFNDEKLRLKINKIAELLHLSIADLNRRNERNDQAIKLQSEVLRKEEMDRATRDYYDILALRGKQFSDMFESLLPMITSHKGLEFLMLITFYFKTTQALIKIDSENDKYVFKARELMWLLLKNGNFSSSDKNLPLFEINLEDFKSSYCFVKKSLLTLYLSGYSEIETDTYLELICCEPTIPNLREILPVLDQTVMKTCNSNPAASKQRLSLLTKNIQADLQKKRNLRNQRINQILRYNLLNEKNQQSGQSSTLHKSQQPSPDTLVQQNALQSGQSSFMRHESQQPPPGTLVQQNAQQSGQRSSMVHTSQQPLPGTLVQQNALQSGQNSFMLHESQQPPSSTSVQQNAQQSGQTSFRVHKSQQPLPGTLVQQNAQQQSGQNSLMDKNQQPPPGTFVQHQQPGQSLSMLHKSQQPSPGTFVQHQQPGQSLSMLHKSQQPPPGTFVQQKAQQSQCISAHQNIRQPQNSQTPGFGVKVPQYLPTFSFLNQPQQSVQNMSQRNIPTSSGGQTYVNHTVQLQWEKSHGTTSAPFQPQHTQHSRSLMPSYGPDTQRGGGGVNYTKYHQSREPVNNITPLMIKIPASNLQQITQNMNVPSKMSQICFLAGCNRQATVVCSLCRQALYCSTSCQAQHWYKSHSSTCLR